MKLGVWTKAAGCECSACVEVMDQGDRVLVRQSTDLEGHVLSFTRTEWATFVGGAKDGDFDL